MKAKIKETGEIIEVRHLNVRLGNEIIAKGYVNVSDSEDVYDCDEFEIMQEKSDCIDWEQRRYEIAKDIYSRNYGDSEITAKERANIAVERANILIAELKKGCNNAND